MKKREKMFTGKKLCFGLERLILGKHRCNGFCGYAPPDELGELAAIVDVRHLEADNEPETEAGYAYEGITDNVDHLLSSVMSPFPVHRQGELPSQYLSIPLPG
jgi:hypothetical protein